MNINLLIADYLIECCMKYELACPQMSDVEFTNLANKIRDNWAWLEHPHKAYINISHLNIGPHGLYIKFPSIVRHVACRRASKLPDNPMSGKPEDFIQRYCTACQGKNFNR